MKILKLTGTMQTPAVPLLCLTLAAWLTRSDAVTVHNQRSGEEHVSRPLHDFLVKTDVSRKGIEVIFKRRPSNQVNPCNVTGLWRNDLGSVMRLSAVGSELRGVYDTAVESSNGAAGAHRNLTGFVSEGLQPTIAFSVLWKLGSCTSWVGQCFTLPNGTQELRTLWLLRSGAENSGDNWTSTRLGADRFVFIR